MSPGCGRAGLGAESSVASGGVFAGMRVACLARSWRRRTTCISGCRIALWTSLNRLTISARRAMASSLDKDWYSRATGLTICRRHTWMADG